MTNVWQELLAARREASGRWLFFRRALAHPLQLATLMPSSASLGRLVARHIAEMRDLGVGQVMCWMNFGGLSRDRVRRSMELFAREVMPRFRRSS